MKKAKMLPSILMLVLCVGVLAMGVYAAMPISHSLNGTISVTAAGAEVAITAYLDNSGVTQDTVMSSTTTTRKESTIQLTQSIEFNCEGVAIGEQDKVPSKKLYLEIQNKSSIALGAYFLEGTVASTGTAQSNIATTRDLNGTATSGTIPEVVTADFTGYTQIPVGGTVKLYCIFTLNKVSSEAVTVNLTNNIEVNIEPYNEKLALEKDTSNAINFTNADNLAVKTNCTLLNAAASSTKITSIANNTWSVDTVAFDESEKYGNNELRLQTIKMQMMVKNTDVVPVKVSIDKKTLEQQNVRATIIGNDYIPAGTTKEISVQFQSVNSRGSSENGDTPVTSNPSSISAYNYEVKIEKASTASALTIHSDTTSSMYTRGFQYYIYFGNNPYYTAGNTKGLEAKLRWYIWAEDDGKGNPTTLTSAPTVGNGKVYYFISEYTLDTSSEDSYSNISFNSEFDWSNYYNFYGDYATDYAGSTLREYLTGLSVRSTCYDAEYDNSDADWGLPNGSYINFYDEFGFTEGDNASILSKIVGRKLGTSEGGLYYDMNYTTAEDSSYAFPTENSNVSESDEDLFWAISYKEYYNFIRRDDYSNAVSYQLSGGTNNTSSSWWLRSPSSSSGECCVLDDGYDNNYYVSSSGVGSRPAFKIQI